MEITFEKVLRQCGHNEQLVREGKTRGLLHDFKVFADGQHIAWWYQYGANGSTDLRGFRYWLKDKLFHPVSNGERRDHAVAAYRREDFEDVVRKNIHLIPAEDELEKRRQEEERKAAARKADEEDRARKYRIEQAAPDMLAALKAAKSILWMAKDYAEGGGSNGPEMRDYTEAEQTIEAAISKAEGQ